MGKRGWMVGAVTLVVMLVLIYGGLGRGGLLQSGFVILLAVGIAAAAGVAASPRVPAGATADGAAAAPLSPGRAVLGAVGAAAAVGLAFLLWVAGIITFTGCFIGCDEASENPVLGVTLMLVALGLIAGASRLVGWAFALRRDLTNRITLIAVALGAALAIVSLVAP